MKRPPIVRVLEREAIVFRRMWWSSIGFALVGPIMFLGAIGLGLGGLVDERTGAVEGLSYLDFIAPGLLVGAAMQASAGDSLWPVMGGFKWMGNFKGMVATPVTPGDIYGARVLWTAVRAALYGAAFLIVAAVLGGVDSVWGVLGVAVAALCAMAFAAPITAFSATQEDDSLFPIVMRLGIIPLFLFSGTFFPIDRLPPLAERLAVLSPLWHAAELARAATTGQFDGGEVVVHVAVLLAFVTAGWLWGTRTFTRRLSL